MNLIGLLIFLIIACVVYWGVMKILGAFGIGNPIATVVQVLMVVMLLLGQFGYGPGLGVRLR